MKLICRGRSGGVVSRSVLAAVGGNDLYRLAVAMFQVREQGESVVSVCMYVYMYVCTVVQQIFACVKIFAILQF